ncbi:hypothetical protein MAR_005990, partial [Mya arenaria]
MDLKGIENDRELLRDIFSKPAFEFKEFALIDSKKTVECFKKELKKDAGCLFVSITRKRLMMKDLIVVYAAVKGHESHMTEDENETASICIKTMCEVIREQQFHSDFVSMMECVNQRICESGNKYQTCVEMDSQLTKKLFLFETKTEKEGEPLSASALGGSTQTRLGCGEPENATNILCGLKNKLSENGYVQADGRTRNMWTYSNQ